MSPRLSCVVIVILVAAVLTLGCAERTPRATTVPPQSTQTETATEPAEPAPVAEEETITEPETATVPSVEVTEELPEDIALLNQRGYLEDVFFATDSYDLTPEAREILASNAEWLAKFPTVRVLVEGHADERNTREYNLALAERRANAVRDYLVFLGIAPERVRTISYGEEKPFAPGHDESAWRLNRRAHFVITAR